MSQPPSLEARISRLGMTLTGPQQPLRPFVSRKQSLYPELDMIKMSQTVNWNERSSTATFKQVILPTTDYFCDFIKQKKLRNKELQ